MYFRNLGIHAREWISPAVTTYAINELTTNHANYSDLLDNLDWYLLPSHNPDGYQFTKEHVKRFHEISTFLDLFFCDFIPGQIMEENQIKQWISFRM